MSKQISSKFALLLMLSILSHLSLAEPVEIGNINDIETVGDIADTAKIFTIIRGKQQFHWSKKDIKERSYSETFVYNRDKIVIKKGFTLADNAEASLGISLCNNTEPTRYSYQDLQNKGITLDETCDLQRTLWDLIKDFFALKPGDANALVVKGDTNTCQNSSIDFFAEESNKSSQALISPTKLLFIPEYITKDNLNTISVELSDERDQNLMEQTEEVKLIHERDGAKLVSINLSKKLEEGKYVIKIGSEKGFFRVKRTGKPNSKLEVYQIANKVYQMRPKTDNGRQALEELKKACHPKD